MCLRFLKTADLVEKEPWCLVKAAKALRDWVDQNIFEVHVAFTKRPEINCYALDFYAALGQITLVQLTKYLLNGILHAEALFTWRKGNCLLGLPL